MRQTALVVRLRSVFFADAEAVNRERLIVAANRVLFRMLLISCRALKSLPAPARDGMARTGGALLHLGIFCMWGRVLPQYRKLDVSSSAAASWSGRPVANVMRSTLTRALDGALSLTGSPDEYF